MRIGPLGSSSDDTNKILDKYSELFTGIGCIKQKYDIILKDNARPVISHFRKVHFTPYEQFKKYNRLIGTQWYWNVFINH